MIPQRERLPSPASVDGLEALGRFVAAHPRLFVLTGAGCSTESGIPDYRDAEGRWKRPQPVTGQAFAGSAATRRRYWARSLVGWRTMQGAAPGPAHRALAALERAGHVECLVTQNVDGLHGAAGSRRVIDLHGRVDTVVCLGCGARSPRAALQAELLRRNPDWAVLDAGAAPDGDADLERDDFDRFEVPACAHCGGVLKPDVVFYGENVPRQRVDAALAALAAADALLVVGSSLMVYSGYRFLLAAVQQARPAAALNLGRLRGEELLRLKVALPAGAGLQALLRALPGAAAQVQAADGAGGAVNFPS